MGITAKSVKSGLTRGIGATLRADPSTAAWPKVYMNPFLKTEARLPCWPVRASVCQYRFAQGYGHCNGNGIGWIACTPLNMICSDIAFAQISSQTTNDGIGIGTDIGSASCGGSYGSASFAEGGFAVRIVAFGLKVKYTGSELNKGGFITYHQVTPRDTLDNMTATSIQSNMIDWKQYDFGNKFTQFNRLYTENDDSLYLKYTGSSETPWQYDDFGTNAPENYNYFGCAINAATANMPFEWQASGHFEIIGPVNNTTGVASPMLNTALSEKTINLGSHLRSKDNTTPDHFGENGLKAALVGGLEMAAAFF